MSHHNPGMEDDPLAQALLGLATTPHDVVPRPDTPPPTFTPGAHIDVVWPGEMTYDVDGLPTGMTEPVTYRMTADQNGHLVGWSDTEGDTEDD